MKLQRKADRQRHSSYQGPALCELGGVFGVSMLGAVFQHIVTSPARMMPAFRTSLVVGGVLVVLAIASALAIRSAASSQAGLQAQLTAA